MMRGSQHSNGFTLIEVLVALTIVSMIAILSWRGLDNVFRLTERIRDVDDVSGQWRAVFGQLGSDLRNVPSERQTSATSSSSKQVVFLADEQGLTLLLADRQTGRPARWTQVRWQLTAGRWSRWSRANVVDEQPQAPPMIVNGPVTRGLRIRLWTPGKGWERVLNYGEPPAGIDPTSFAADAIPGIATTENYSTPTGLEICAALPDGRRYTRIFRIGSAA
jgi:general secretion pathway protein J